MRRRLLALWYASDLVALALWNVDVFTQPEVGRRNEATGITDVRGLAKDVVRAAGVPAAYARPDGTFVILY